jgi:hypothetical protein
MLCFALANEAQKEPESSSPDFTRAHAHMEMTLMGMRNDFSCKKTPGPSLQIYLGDT